MFRRKGKKFDPKEEKEIPLKKQNSKKYKCERREEYICCRLLNDEEKAKKVKEAAATEVIRHSGMRVAKEAAAAGAAKNKSNDIIDEYKKESINIHEIKNDFLEYIDKELHSVEDNPLSALKFLKVIDRQGIITINEWYYRVKKEEIPAIEYHSEELIQYAIDEKTEYKIPDIFNEGKKKYNEYYKRHPISSELEFLLPILKINDEYVCYNIFTKQFLKKKFNFFDKTYEVFIDKRFATGAYLNKTSVKNSKDIDDFLVKYLKDDDKNPLLKKKLREVLNKFKGNDDDTKRDTIGGGKRKKSRKKKSRKSRKAKRVKKSRKAKSKSNKKTRKKHH